MMPGIQRSVGFLADQYSAWENVSSFQLATTIDIRLMGATVRTIPAVLGLGVGLAVLQGVFTYTGGAFSGYDKGPSVDEFDRKQQLRKNRRRPIQETLDELGEGRGTKPPHILPSNGPLSVDIHK